MENNVYLIGHGNLSMYEFLDNLKSKEVVSLIDVRSVPYSKFVPHFNKVNLQKELEKEGIKYMFKGDVLGGRPAEGFDVFLHSKKFEKHINSLLPILSSSKCAIMCSEIDYEKCHRRFIGMRLSDKGFKVSNMGKKLEIIDQKTLGTFK